MDGLARVPMTKLRFRESEFVPDLQPLKEVKI